MDSRYSAERQPVDSRFPDGKKAGPAWEPGRPADACPGACLLESELGLCLASAVERGDIFERFLCLGTNLGTKRFETVRNGSKYRAVHGSVSSSESNIFKQLKAP